MNNYSEFLEKIEKKKNIPFRGEFEFTCNLSKYQF